MGPSRAIGELSRAVADFGRALDSDTETSAALAGAANDLQELRAKLETSRQVDVNDIPDDIIYPIEIDTFDENGDGREEVKPFAFTHEVADEWWGIKSNEIVQSYASKISDPQARAEFIEDVSTRWVVPGTLAINKASITKRVAHNRGMAEVAIDSVLASDLPNSEKEQAAIKIIDRHRASGGDPIWAASKKSALGPQIDQIEYQNKYMKATTQEEVEDIRDEMWGANNRMSAEQLRTLDSQADQLVNKINKKEQVFQRENADTLWVGIDRGQVRASDVTLALEKDQITSIEHNKMMNALDAGGSADYSNDAHLSAFRSRIIQIPYTGGTSTVRERGRKLKNQVMMAARGLTPTGTPTGLPTSITGTDAQKLISEIDTAVKKALKTPDYDRAWEHIRLTLGVRGGVTDMAGNMLYGSEPAVRASMAFKRALDTYVDQYGVDARPMDFVMSNQATFTKENYDEPINIEFVELYPPAKSFMTESPDGTLTFSAAQQTQFRKDIKQKYDAGAIGTEKMNEISARFMAYYMGQAIPPPQDALQLETPNVLYGQ